MRNRKTLRRILAGLMAALVMALVLPPAGLAQETPLGFDALEIFAQEEHVTTPRTTGEITPETTAFPSGLPESTSILFVIGGMVSALDEVNGEWQIGSVPIYVYESDQTVIGGTPGLGDPVRVVGKRTLAEGPIVAQYITAIDTTPDGPAQVSTALLFNGTLTSIDAGSWTVTPAVGGPVDFNILPDAGIFGHGPTAIHLGIGEGSAVTVEYVIDPSTLPPDDDEKPKNLMATPVSYNHVNLTWEARGLNLTGFIVERSGDAGASYGIISNNVSATARSYDDFTVQPNSSYMYQVRAFNEAGSASSASNPVSVATPMPPEPAAPSSLTAPAIAYNQITLSWTDVADEAGYRVERATGTGNFTVIADNLPPDTVSYTDTIVAQNTSYQYRVVAFNVSGEAAAGALSVITPFAPSDENGSNGGGSGVGGETEIENEVELEGLTGDDILKVDSSGKSKNSVRLSNSGPGRSTNIDILAGTVLKTAEGSALTSIAMSEPDSLPPPPPGANIITAQELGPSGATFNPSITLMLTFDPAELPAGVSEDDLTIAYWDGVVWIPLETTIDLNASLMSVQVNHFTVFGILAKLPATTPAIPTTPAASITPTTPTTPTTPVTPITPTVPTAPAPGAPPTGPNWGLIGGIMAVAVLGIGGIVYRVRRKTAGQ